MEATSHTTTSPTTTSTIIKTTTERMVVETKHFLWRRHTREWRHIHIGFERWIHKGPWTVHIVIIETKAGKSVVHEWGTSHIHPIHIRRNKHIRLCRHWHIVIVHIIKVSCLLLKFSDLRFSFFVNVFCIAVVR